MALMDLRGILKNFDLSFRVQNTANSSGSDKFALEVNVIPEPSTYALIFGGFALGVVLLKRRMGSRAAKDA